MTNGSSALNARGTAKQNTYTHIQAYRAVGECLLISVYATAPVSHECGHSSTLLALLLCRVCDVQVAKSEHNGD